jgi:toxin HigB-1
MIRSFGNLQTEVLFAGWFVREYSAITRSAQRKLEMLQTAARLDDLRSPPSNRLEKLKRDLGSFYSIRSNDQWRIIFR